MMRKWMRVALPLACMTLAAFASESRGAEYETQMDRLAKDAIPAELATGPAYSVKDPVVADGYMYRFTVVSTYGPFEVTGTGALRKLQREISAIGEMKNITTSEAFLKSLKDQASKPIAFVKDVVTKPIDTLGGVPRGVGRLFSNISSSVTSPSKPSQESRTKELLLVGGFKREYAARFGVDPYSSNQVMQDELDKLANASAFGSWTASIGTMPIGGSAGAVLSATSLSKSFNNVLQNEPPSRIRTINEEKLKQMGVPESLAEKYLDQPYYTPRQNLIMVDSLHRLGAATGREAFLTASMAAAEEDEANFFVNTAQILRGYHESQGKINSITMVGALAVAQSSSGVAVIPFALDYGVWTANADRLSQELRSSYRAPGFNGNFEFWVSGAVSPAARRALEGRGFKVVEQANTLVEIID
jgi:hypothetical protein